MSHSDSPNMKSPRPDLDGNGDSDIFSDPLLGSGSFIDASTYSSRETLEHWEAPNHRATPAQPLQGRDDSVASASAAPESSKAARANTDSQSEPRSQRKRKSISTVPSERPDWLPSDWVVEDRMRTSGATAGSVDKYYFDPVSGRRFRSKIEVMYFLETGSVRKKKMSENPDSDAKPSASLGGKKQKKSSTKVKKAPLNFDFQNVPERIKWVLTDSVEGTWYPFAGEVKVPESTKKEWVAAFKSLSEKNGGRITI